MRSATRSSQVLRLVAAALVILFSSSFRTTQAAPGDALGSAFEVLPERSPQQTMTSVARAPGGSFVVVWRDGKQDLIFGRRFAANGIPLGDGFAISSTPANVNDTDVVPDVAMNEAGDFVVTWLRVSRDGHGVNRVIPPGRAFARRYRPDGSAAAPEFEVDAPEVSVTDGAPRVAMAGNGDFAIAFERLKPVAIVPSIYIPVYGGTVGFIGAQEVRVQRYQADGTAKGAPLVAAQRANVEIGYVAPISLVPGVVADTHITATVDVAMNADGDLAVAWGGQTLYTYDTYAFTDSHASSIFARAYDRNGSARGLPQTVDSSVRVLDQIVKSAPAIAMNGEGGYVVAWTEAIHKLTGSIEPRNPAETYARRFNPDGSRAGAAIDVGASYDPTYWGVAAGSDRAGDFQIAWFGPLGLTGRRYSATGTPRAPVFSVMPDLPEIQIPSLASDALGNFVVSWTNQDSALARLYEGP